MPRSFSAFAILVALVIPSAWIASTTGKRLAARNAALARQASAAPAAAFFKFHGPPSLTPRTLAAAIASLVRFRLPHPTRLEHSVALG